MKESISQQVERLRQSHVAVWYALKEAMVSFQTLLAHKAGGEENQDLIERWMNKAHGVLVQENPSQFDQDLRE